MCGQYQEQEIIVSLISLLLTANLENDVTLLKILNLPRLGPSTMP